MFKLNIGEAAFAGALEGRSASKGVFSTTLFFQGVNDYYKAIHYKESYID